MFTVRKLHLHYAYTNKHLKLFTYQIKSTTYSYKNNIPILFNICLMYDADLLFADETGTFEFNNTNCKFF